MNGTNARVCLALTLGLWGSGCALPSIEGVFDNRDFVVFDTTPEARGESGDEVLLVFVDVEQAKAELRTVSIDLRRLSSLPVDEDIAVGSGAWDDDRPCIEVVEGTLVTEPLDDGGTLITSGDDAKRAMSLGGTLTLSENGATVAGSFHVDLDDGGYLEGAFTSAR